MTAPILEDGTIVNADDHWNPMASEANATAAGLATEITNRSNADAAINTRLNSNIAGGGISDLPTWKTTIDNRTTDASTGNAALGTRMTAAEGTITSHTGSITTLNTRTTDASTGNVALGTRVTTLESRTTNATTGNTQLGTRVTTLEARTTDATTGNTALGDRVTALEGASAAVGPWTACTLTSPWANRGAGFYNLRVRLLPGGNIQLIGNITRTSGNPANGEQFAVLPVSHRPSQDTHIPVAYNNGTVGMAKIDSGGLLTAFGAGANPIANFNYTFAGSSSGA
jgi:hypothetical protein